ncbi:MAG: DUF2207 domain-containing protein [Acidimicrobiales bacterium]
MRRFARVLGALAALVALAVALAEPARAQFPAQGAARAQVGERIHTFDVVITVNGDGSLSVIEKIRYDFGTDQRHGIFRTIPVRFDYEPDSRYERLTPIDDPSVDGGLNTPDNLEVETSGRSTRFKIGDPDRTITGAHDYTISYRVRGALNSFSEHDELFWNATGNEWPVAVGAVSVTVQVPGDVTEVACYAGPTGSRLPCESAVPTGHGATFSHGALSSGEGVTVVVAMPKGTVTVPPPILDERWSVSRAFSVTPLTVGVSGGLTALILFGLVRLVWSRGRDRRWAGSPVDAAFGSESGQEETVPLFERSHDPVEFEPPNKVRPGQVGTLVDEVANPLDVTATIIDLAVRGYLRIEEIPKKGLFGKTDWKMTKVKEPDDLRPYERKLHDGIFEGGDEVELSDLKRKFATRLKGVQDALYDDVVAAGWFPSRPDRVRLKGRVIGVLVLVAALAGAVALAALTHWGLLGIPLIVGAAGLLAGAGRLPRRTPAGWATLRRVSGFRRFIEESEKERARFAERANLFSEYLPFAVVFGCTDKWARAFSGLEAEVAQATSGWYVSSHPFSLGGFGNSMDSFAVTTSGTIVATAASSGSSGFGGGGSSGGGFGGGGGGSW